MECPLTWFVFGRVCGFSVLILVLMECPLTTETAEDIRDAKRS